MGIATVDERGRPAEVAAFVAHLRARFQLLVAPTAYLLGVLFADRREVPSILLQFVNVHLLYLGGATAFNSYYDHDRGPIEGLRHPPAMKPWMLPASLALQAVGLALAAWRGAAMAAIYLASIAGFSFAYSHPAIRLKGRPILSLFAIGAFGAASPFLMGFLAAGGTWPPPPAAWLALLGSALVVVALFTPAQAHQIDEDRERGDLTFSARFGLGGIRRLFAACYPAGVAAMSLSMARLNPPAALMMLTAGCVAGALLWREVRGLDGTVAHYEVLGRLKLWSGALFNLFLATLIVLR